MTGSEGATTATEWIKDHLWQIGTVIAIAYTGYLTGTMTMANDIAVVKADVARLEARIAKHELETKRVLDGRRGFINQTAGPVNYLCEKDEGCSRRYPAVTVPE